MAMTPAHPQPVAGHYNLFTCIFIFAAEFFWLNILYICNSVLWYMIVLYLWYLIVQWETQIHSFTSTFQIVYCFFYIFIVAHMYLCLPCLYPKLLSDFLSERQVISYGACLFQAFCLYTYAASEYALLSAMAYDRYVSICKPLQYATLIKMSTVKKILYICWFLPSCQNLISVILTYRLQLCKCNLNRIYCNFYSIVKLSCGDITANNSYGLFSLSVTVFPPVIFIIYSYVRILDVCLKNSKVFRRKALQTCFPHLFIFISFTVTSCFEVINSRLEGNVLHIFAMIMSVENVVIPPLINPIIYGLKLQEIFKIIKKIIWQVET